MQLPVGHFPDVRAEKRRYKYILQEHMLNFSKMESLLEKRDWSMQKQNIRLHTKKER